MLGDEVTVAMATDRGDPAESRAGSALPKPGPLRGRLTLGVKGALAMIVLLLYLGFVGVLFVLQRDALIREFDGIAGTHRLLDRIHDLRLAAANLEAAAHALPGQVDVAAPNEQLDRSLEDLLRLAKQDGGETVSGDRLALLTTALREYRASPQAMNLTGVRQALDGYDAELVRADARVAAFQNARESAFRAQSQTMAATVLAVGLLGIALIWAVVVLFLARITSDLEALRVRTNDIIAGRRRRPIPVTRPDEVGKLTGAINELAAALEARERELELERHKSFHHEKIAAIGNLAAGVLTEIGNPIAAIDGFARAMRDEQRFSGPGDGEGKRGIDEILEQVARLASIAHDIAEIAVPQPAQQQLVDLNEIVQTAVRLLHYDARARAAGIVVDLDQQLPAIPGRADRLGHLVMNLAGNAIDAMGGYRAGEPGIRITTTADSAGVILELVDRGHGMSDAVSNRAFEPFFSTKPAGHGTGLGLPLCQSIVAEHGGTIRLDSVPGNGTRVTVTFPCRPGMTNEGQLLP